MILYGIPNCDTVKKARNWLDSRGIEYAFHDYKKAGADPAKLAEWSAAKAWEALLSKRGTTFRKLDDADKADLDEAKAIALMVANPSLIRRPVVEHDGGLLIGFDPAEWQTALA
jgi:Spx/MgsR family transcriptional regulator